MPLNETRSDEHMNMKPFNLEAALRGEPVVTRDGRQVILAGFSPKIAEPISLAAWARSTRPDDKSATLLAYNSKGQFYPDGEASPFDLFMAPRVVTKWGAVLRNSFGQYVVSAHVWDSEEEAREYQQPNLPRLVKIFPLVIEE
jgi:hypothetical protein